MFGIVVFLLGLYKFRNARHQTVYILPPAVALGPLVCRKVAPNSCFFNNLLAQRVGIFRQPVVHKLLHEGFEKQQLADSSTVNSQLVFYGMADYFPQADTVFLCRSHYFLDGSVAYSPCRIVDNAAESLFVVGVDNQTEVSNDILYLLALIEA